MVVLVIETLLAKVKGTHQGKAKRRDIARRGARGHAFITMNAHLLSSGLYRRPWLLTRSADPAA
jgi:hypothetical protein